MLSAVINYLGNKIKKNKDDLTSKIEVTIINAKRNNYFLNKLKILTINAMIDIIVALLVIIAVIIILLPEDG